VVCVLRASIQTEAHQSCTHHTKVSSMHTLARALVHNVISDHIQQFEEEELETPSLGEDTEFLSFRIYERMT
jgi:hypothetical protein